MTDHRILLDIEKNKRERLRVSISNFKGVDYIHIRNWYANTEGEERQPGKGIAVKPEHLARVIEALQRAREGE